MHATTVNYLFAEDGTQDARILKELRRPVPTGETENVTKVRLGDSYGT